MIRNEEFDRDMKKTIEELNELRRRVRALIDNPDTPGIVGVIDHDFMIGFVSGDSKEVMLKEDVVELFDEAIPYWELLEWGDKEDDCKI